MPKAWYPAAPECEKLVAVSEQSNLFGDFLEWLVDEMGYAICEEVHDPQGSPEYSFMPIRTAFGDLLAAYFGIDMCKVEQERRAILEYLQQHQDKEAQIRITVDGEEIANEE
jgi:hypothetical protein